MQTVNVAEAKARLSEILAEVENGAEVLITRQGHPIARLFPVDSAALDALRSRQPLSRVSSVQVVRKARDVRRGPRIKCQRLAAATSRVHRSVSHFHDFSLVLSHSFG